MQGPFAERWTAPKLGAVRLRNTAACDATDSGTPFPPSMPARTIWRASPRYVFAHGGQRVSRLDLQATSSTPSGSPLDRESGPLDLSRIGQAQPPVLSTRLAMAIRSSPLRS